MVVYDLAFHDFCLTTAVREYISEKYGLTADQLVILSPIPMPQQP